MGDYMVCEIWKPLPNHPTRALLMRGDERMVRSYPNSKPRMETVWIDEYGDEWVERIDRIHGFEGVAKIRHTRVGWVVDEMVSMMRKVA